MKFKPNSPCWCGSGKKFKKCHRDRREATPPRIHKTHQDMNIFLRRKTCLGSEASAKQCSSRIVSAHTIPKGVALNSISTGGHVWGFGHNGGLPYPKESDGPPRPKIEKVGINQASTFKGFCETHDTELFKCFENKIFECNIEQVTAMTFRTICRELYLKIWLVEQQEILREWDAGFPIEKQILFQRQRHLIQIGAKSAVRDQTFYKEILDAEILSSSYSAIQFACYEFDNFPIFTSGTFYPEVDIHGQELQNLSAIGIRQQPLTFNTIVGENSTYVVLSWFADYASAPIKLVSQISDSKRSDVPKLLANIILQHIENVYFDPIWLQLQKDRIALIESKMGIGAGVLDHPDYQYENFEGLEGMLKCIAVHSLHLTHPSSTPK